VKPVFGSHLRYGKSQLTSGEWLNAVIFTAALHRVSDWMQSYL
jgi:hypothetical protein